MIPKFRLAFGWMLLLTASVFSQTELVDPDFSGIHPYAGVKWNSKITQPLIGLEYVVQHRMVLGIQAAVPLTDTLFAHPGDDSLVSKNFHSYFINPYFVFELLEPDNADPFSFSVRGDYIYEGVRSDSSGNGFSRNAFGMGPIFSYAFPLGLKFELVPSIAYEFFYTKWKRDWPTHVNIIGSSPLYNDEYFIQHSVSVGTDAVYHLTETQGLNLEPKIVLKFGQGFLNSDLFNIEARFGYFFSF